MQETIRVILIDDHRSVHQTVSIMLGTLPDIELIGQGSNGADAIDLCAELKPDILLIDVVMPVMDGPTAVQIVHERFPEIQILALSSFQDDESVYAMLRNGASGFVLKSSLTHDLPAMIRATHKGAVVLAPEVAARLLQPPGEASDRPKFSLSARELEILGLMAEGMGNNQIAYALKISQSTVKYHLQNILRKLGVETRSQALVVATKNNLV